MRSIPDQTFRLQVVRKKLQVCTYIQGSRRHLSLSNQTFALNSMFYPEMVFSRYREGDHRHV
jgi:hypothetical protein